MGVYFNKLLEKIYKNGKLRFGLKAVFVLFLIFGVGSFIWFVGGVLVAGFFGAD